MLYMLLNIYMCVLVNILTRSHSLFLFSLPLSGASRLKVTYRHIDAGRKGKQHKININFLCFFFF
jgi:hypothetical protein